MDSGFTFGMFSTWDFDVHVEKYPAQHKPARKMTTYSVAGRNGDLHVVEDAWENYPQYYEVYFHSSDHTAPEQAHKVAAWLMSGAGYQRLQDTYDPGYYRMAMCKGPLDIENKLNKYGRCTITFDCAPQSFLLEGDRPLLLSAANQIRNPTLFNAKPIITVFGTGAGAVTVGGTTVKINSISDPIILNCETMQAYSQLGDAAPENQNGSIYAPVFPVLSPGVNQVSFSGGITGIQIIPRWWTL